MDMKQLKLLKIFIFLIITKSIKSDSCPATENGCSCSTTNMKINNSPGWEITCNNGENQVYSPNHVQFTCGSEVPYKSNMFGKYNVIAQKYDFVQCPLPNMTVASLLHTTDISSISFSGVYKQHQQSEPLNATIFANITGLENFALSIFNFETLPRDLFSNMTKLVVLTLDNNNLMFLPETLFKNLTNLRDLSLSYNLLTSLTTGIFNGLVKLRSLFLNNNRLTHLSVAMLRNLISLTDLEIKYNCLTALEPFAFAANRNLNRINMGGNAFREFGANVLSNVTNLTNIDLSDNQNLTIIHEDMFGNLSSLTNLSFASCRVTHWPEKLFKGIPNLQYLNMNFNGIDTLPENLYTYNDQLISLDLSFNELSELPSKIFIHQSMLQTLTIRMNSFKNLPADAFQNLPNLTNLNMDKNFIESIQGGDLDYLFGLETLSLANNNISSIPLYETFGLHLRFLQFINLSNNNIANFVDVNWQVYTSLQVLDLSFNQIKSITLPILFVNTTINLRNNLIEHINAEDTQVIDPVSKRSTTTTSFNKYTNGKFQLGNNPFSCDCNMLNFKLFLTFIANNNIQKLFPDDRMIQCATPTNLSGKSMLSLPDNEFKCPVSNCPANCSCYLQALYNVTYVNCSDTQSVSLSLDVPFNTSVVYYKNNNLSTLSGMNNTSWNSVRDLYVDNNLLTASEWHLPVGLEIISLTGNRLQSIPSTLTNLAQKNGVKLYLGNNPWYCTCSAQSIWNLLQYSHQSIGDFANITCEGPSNLQGLSMGNITEADLCPVSVSNQTALIILAIVCGIILLIAFTICVLYYRNKQVVVAYLYIHYFKIYSVFFREDLDEDKYYHAFISYSSSDRDVALALIEELENNEPQFKLCIHERDWQPGNLITFNIINSVQNSRRTILVLSEDFINSVWFQLEFHIAYYQMLEDKIDRLIVIVKGVLPEKDKLDKDLQILLTTKTYLEWSEKWFWEKLKYALPHRKILKTQIENPQNPSRALVRKIEDKILSLTAETVEPNKTMAQLVIENNNRNSHINNESHSDNGLKCANGLEMQTAINTLHVDNTKIYESII